MKIVEYEDTDNVVLYLDGSLDETSDSDFAGKIENYLSMDQVSNIFLDLSKVDYISSLGIRALMVAHKKGVKTQKKISLINVPDKTMELMKIVGILPLFERSGG